jgi:hypothetical protein
MRVDMREHKTVRDLVHAGIAALRVQGRQIWGSERHMLLEIVTRLVVTVGDVARHARDGKLMPAPPTLVEEHDAAWRDLKKELGNILFSTIRWIDDLGLDPLECLDLAINAQEAFVKSGRPR